MIVYYYTLYNLKKYIFSGNVMINFPKDEHTKFLSGIDLNLQTIKAAELKVHWKPISNPSIKRSKVQFQMTVYDVINKLKNQKKAMDVKTIDDILDICPAENFPSIPHSGSEDLKKSRQKTREIK